MTKSELSIPSHNAATPWIISPQERVFLGDALIETLSVQGGIAQHSLSHWQRLQHSAVFMGYRACPDFETWHLALQQQIKHDNLVNGGVKAILTGGVACRGLLSQGEDNRLLVQTFIYEPSRDPIRVARATWQRDALNPIYQVKAMSYLEGIFAQRYAQRAGADDVLFFNQQEHATETSCANLFVIHQNKILTPPIADGLVSGIIRKILLTQSRDINLMCMEQSITLETLMQAEAVFVTNALQGIRCVQALDDINWPTTHPFIEKIQSLLL
ncbi:MAG: hypothetical protein BGO90_11605 [Legionella sp. 40-6]|nr:aminotransferase class IV [Legionella sp.]OJY06081.1 MAG: hypothetical protein BGO90_11605 [Legionella sp. 40-6]